MDLSSRSMLLVLQLLLFSLIISVSSCDPHCQPPPTPKPPAPSTGTCPRDALKLRACANVLNGLLHLQLGTTTPSKEGCCNLIHGMTDLEAAACLCTAIKANVLGINLNVPVSMTMLLNYCGHEVPREFQCA